MQTKYYYLMLKKVWDFEDMPYQMVTSYNYLLESDCKLEGTKSASLVHDQDNNSIFYESETYHDTEIEHKFTLISKKTFDQLYCVMPVVQDIKEA